jgi:hypothetical protein
MPLSFESLIVLCYVEAVRPVAEWGDQKVLVIRISVHIIVLRGLYWSMRTGVMELVEALWPQFSKSSIHNQSASHLNPSFCTYQVLVLYSEYINVEYPVPSTEELESLAPGKLDEKNLSNIIRFRFSLVCQK